MIMHNYQKGVVFLPTTMYICATAENTHTQKYFFGENLQEHFHIKKKINKAPKIKVVHTIYKIIK